VYFKVSDKCNRVEERVAALKSRQSTLTTARYDHFGVLVPLPSEKVMRKYLEIWTCKPVIKVRVCMSMTACRAFD
jgi:hypothetical protein